MNKHNQEGEINVLLLPLILAILFLFGALGFGFWAYGSRQDYKNNSDQKVADAVAQAKTAEDALKDKQYAEAAKLPLKTYNGPEQYGSLALQYPKTWSGYVAVGDSNGDTPLNGYFSPNVVPAVDDQSSTFALRLHVLDQSYSDVVSNFDNQEGITSQPYSLPKVPKAVGVKISGQIEQDKQGSMVILPIRDKTIEIYTESADYQSDFNNIILPNLTFAP